MRAIVKCTCESPIQTEVETSTLAELGEAAMSLVVSAHATHPHCDHPMTLELDVEYPDREVVVTCLKTECQKPREFRAMVPRELVGAMTILFHTSHEGHRMRISYDGREWSSPPDGSA